MVLRSSHTAWAVFKLSTQWSMTAPQTDRVLAPDPPASPLSAEVTGVCYHTQSQPVGNTQSHDKIRIVVLSKTTFLPVFWGVSMAGPWEALMRSLPSMFLQKPNCEYPSLLCQWQKFFCPSNFSVPKVSPKFRKVWSSQTGHMQAPPTRLRRRNCFYILYKRSSISSKRNLQTPLNLCPLSVYIHGHHMDGVLRACN